jgi:putative Holliday junction resolvase
MRCLGVDLGGKRVGLALGDDATGVATPLEVVPYRGVEAAAETLAAAARRHGAERVVIGLPTRAAGSETPACRRSHAVAAALAGRGLEVRLQAEHLSTDEARRRAREAGLPSDRAIDHLAAQVILEEHLAGGGRRGRA